MGGLLDVLTAGSALLDPCCLRTDDELWDVLRRAGADEVCHQRMGCSPNAAKLVLQFGGLSAALTEGGSNISAGQRQLLSFARLLLKGWRLVILDEVRAPWRDGK